MTTAMNPGLGGGPLLDVRGEVLGVVSLNLNEIGRFSLVVPAEYYLDATDRFLAHSHPGGLPGRAWLGIFSYAMKEHVVVAGLLPGGPGEQAGLKAGDVILAVDGDEVRDRRTFYQLLWRRRPGDEVTLRSSADVRSRRSGSRRATSRSSSPRQPCAPRCRSATFSSPTSQRSV